MTTEELLIIAERLCSKSNYVINSNLETLSDNISRLSSAEYEFSEAMIQYKKQLKLETKQNIEITQPDSISYFKNHPELQKDTFDKTDLNVISGRILHARSFGFGDAENDLNRIIRGLYRFDSVNVTII
jgi:hypothetical protein